MGSCEEGTEIWGVIKGKTLLEHLSTSLSRTSARRGIIECVKNKIKMV